MSSFLFFKKIIKNLEASLFLLVLQFLLITIIVSPLFNFGQCFLSIIFADQCILIHTLHFHMVHPFTICYELVPCL